MMQANFHRESEAELLQRLKAGEQQAWIEYTRYYSAKLYNYLATSLPDAESTEDILNETMGAAVKAIQKFDGQTSLTTLTFALARRKVADFWRKRLATQALEESGPLFSPQVDELVQERLEFLQAMNRLPKAQQEALLLRYQVGLSVGEIAQSMQRSYKAAESLLSRARDNLREAINDLSITSLPDPAQFQQTVHSVLQMLDTQVQRCRTRGMNDEAALFEHYANELVAMAHDYRRPVPHEIRSNSTFH